MPLPAPPLDPFIDIPYPVPPHWHTHEHIPAAPVLRPTPAPTVHVPPLHWFFSESGSSSVLRCPSCDPNRTIWACHHCTHYAIHCQCIEHTPDKYQVCFYCLGYSCVCNLIICPTHCHPS